MSEYKLSNRLLLDFLILLMDELPLQADQSGTIVEIVAEDGKPVSIDTVSFPNKSLALVTYHIPVSGLVLTL